MTKTLATVALFAALAFAFYGFAAGKPLTEGPPKWPKLSSTARGL